MIPCVVAVDVGNSAVKFAIQRGDAIVDHAIAIGDEGWERLAIGWISDQVDCARCQWRIASVHSAAATRLSRAIDQANLSATIQLVTRHDVPMPIDVDHPDRLGIDRLLGAFAASARFGGPTVVVDAGSAVTVDWIDAKGCFCGGAILPGLGLQSKALATGTEALPAIGWESDLAVRLPAKNTADAIRAGILTGIAASIDALIEQYCRMADGDAAVPVVLTGGDGRAIAPLLRNKHTFMPNLVCRGLFDLPRSIAENANTSKEY